MIPLQFFAHTTYLSLGLHHDKLFPDDWIDKLAILFSRVRSVVIDLYGAEDCCQRGSTNCMQKLWKLAAKLSPDSISVDINRLHVWQTIHEVEGRQLDILPPGVAFPSTTVAVLHRGLGHMAYRHQRLGADWWNRLPTDFARVQLLIHNNEGDDWRQSYGRWAWVGEPLPVWVPRQSRYRTPVSMLGIAMDIFAIVDQTEQTWELFQLQDSVPHSDYWLDHLASKEKDDTILSIEKMVLAKLSSVRDHRESQRDDKCSDTKDQDKEEAEVLTPTVLFRSRKDFMALRRHPSESTRIDKEALRHFEKRTTKYWGEEMGLYGQWELYVHMIIS